MSLKVWFGEGNGDKRKRHDKSPISFTKTRHDRQDQHQSVVRLIAALIWTSPILTISSLVGIVCVLSHTTNVTSSIGIAVFVVSVLTTFREYNHQIIVKQRSTDNGHAEQDRLPREVVVDGLVENNGKEYFREGNACTYSTTSNDESTSSSRLVGPPFNNTMMNATATGDGVLSQIRNHDSVMDFGSYSSDDGDRKVKSKHKGLRSILKSKKAEQEFDNTDNESTRTEDSSCYASSDDGVPLNPTAYISLIPSGSSQRSIQNKTSPEEIKRDESPLGDDDKNVLNKASRVEMTLDTALSTMIQETIKQMEESSVRMRSLVLERAERLKWKQSESLRLERTLIADSEKPPSPPQQSEWVPPPQQNLRRASDITKQYNPPMTTLSIHFEENEDETQLTDDLQIRDEASECGTEFYLQRFPYQTPLTLKHRPSNNAMFCTPLGGGGGVIATASMVEEESENVEGRDDDGPSPQADHKIISPNHDHKVGISLARSDSSAPDDEKREDIILNNVRLERQQGDFNSFVNNMMTRHEKGILGMAEELGNSIHTKLTEEIGPSLHSRFGF